MSKLFDKVSGATEHSYTDGNPTPLDLDREMTLKHALDQQILAGKRDSSDPDERKGSDSPAGKVAQFQLANCRKIKLPTNAGKPVVSGGENIVAPAIEAYKSVRTRLMRTQTNRNINSVVVTSAAQGDGKTLTAFNLAFCYAQLENAPVLLIDGDLRTDGLGVLTGNVQSVGLGDVLSGAASYEDVITATDVPNLYVMAAGASSVLPTELFAGDAWEQLLTWSKEFFGLVLVDSPPITPVADFDLIAAACGGILLVVREGQTRREILERALAQIDSKKLIGVVWNAAQASASDNYYYYGKKGR